MHTYIHTYIRFYFCFSCYFHCFLLYKFVFVWQINEKWEKHNIKSFLELYGMSSIIWVYGNLFKMNLEKISGERTVLTLRESLKVSNLYFLNMRALITQEISVSDALYIQNRGFTPHVFHDRRPYNLFRFLCWIYILLPLWCPSYNLFLIMNK